MEIKLKYFKLKEFDQPGLPGSNIHMDLNLLIILDKMRHRAGIPLKINSAYRSPEYNATLKNSSKTSAHCLGKAVDISATDSISRYKILEAAVHFGIQRIGISRNFIHIDIKENQVKLAWLY